MEIKAKDQQPKKGFWATIWESMTKTGGCCGAGGSCGCSSQPDSAKEKAEKKNDVPATCCSK